MKPPLKQSNTCGFTVAEMMVATIIFALLMAAVTAGTIAFSRLYVSVASTSDVQRQERWLDGHLGRDIRMAKDIVTSADELVITDNESITYRMVAQANGTHDLVRIEGLETRSIVQGVQDWIFPTDPDADLNLTITLTISAVDGRGQPVNQAISGSFARRLALY